MNAMPENVEVRPAEWPADLVVVQMLFQSYFAALRADPAVPGIIRGKDREPELQALQATYLHSSEAIVLLARRADQVCGCIVARLLPAIARAAEIKRLYVVPEARAGGIGRALILNSIVWAQQHGAQELLLDTVPEAMPGAVRLYRTLGFTPIDCYNENTGPEFGFFRRSLLHPAPAAEGK